MEENKRNLSDEDLSWDESDEDLNINSTLTVQGVKSSKQNILHFIPSAQMKILKGILFFVIRKISPCREKSIQYFCVN